MLSLTGSPSSSAAAFTGLGVSCPRRPRRVSGARHDKGDVVAGRMQRVQRSNGDLGCTQVHEP